MTLSPRDAYLETQVTTATPQCLRLMLIEEALRRVRAALIDWDAGRTEEGGQAVERCRELVAELIGGVRPELSSVASQALGIYLFLFSTLTEARLSGDRGRLADIVRVLEEERQTWREVCRQFPEPLAAAAAGAAAAEELAPARVGQPRPCGYGPSSAPAAAPVSFSIEA
jgi:flagellar protein FliS